MAISLWWTAYRCTSVSQGYKAVQSAADSGERRDAAFAGGVVLVLSDVFDISDNTLENNSSPISQRRLEF